MARGILLLLAALLCSAAATLDVEEQQKEEKALDSTRELTKKNSVERAPDTPTGFVVLPQTAKIIRVQWDEPSGGADGDYYLVYVENPYREDNTTESFHRWTGLEACTDYDFGVRAVSAEGDMSDPALGHGTTLVGVPSRPPQNLRVEDYTRTTVTLAWEKPDTQCDIVNYRVIYKGGGSDLQEISTTEKTLVVEGLSSNTSYTFSVYAATSAGEGRLPATTEQTTAPDRGPPEDLVAQGINPSAINISWSAPYMLPTYYLVSSPDCMDTEQQTNDLTYLITGLEPCQSCSITVSSFYDSENTKLSETTTAESQKDAPPPPDKCKAEVDKDAVTVYWQPPTTACVLGPYDVTWTWQKLWGDGEEESNSTSTTKQSYTVYNPPPYHNYTFEIAASVDDVFGSPIFCSGTSFESPAGPPVLLSVVSEEEGMAQVTWDSPAEENGEILQYGIFVNDAGNSTKNVSGEAHSTSVTFPTCINVSISVEAFNHAGWGERSEAKDLIIANDVLPEELNCPDPNPDVQVCWDPHSTSCPVSQYNLKWEGDVLWSDSADSSSTTLEWSENEICYSIPSTPYTRYTVELSVGTKLDETITCSVTTPMAASSPPKEVHQTSNSPNSVTIEWSLPESIRGKLLGWHLNWTTSTNEYIDEHRISNPETMTFQINDLSPSETYSVNVMAVNDAGKGEAKNQKITTEDDPSPDLGIILGVSIGGGVILILLIVSAVTYYKMKNKKKTPKSAPFVPDASNNGGISQNPRLSIANQQFLGESGAIDPYNDKVPSSLISMVELNRSDDVNKRMENFEEYNKHSSNGPESKPKAREYRRRPSQPNHKKYVRRSSQQADLDKPNLKKIGRRPSQQIDLGRPNLKEFGRRPSQLADLGRPNLKEFGRRPSQQIDQARPRLSEFGRRPSQQIGLGKPNLREYGRRPSQQIDIGRSGSVEYARRPSQQVNIDAGALSGHPPQQPIPAYDQYMRRPSQQADVGMLSNAGLMRRPSQQFVTTFDGIRE